MKTLAVFLAFYIVLLCGIPCADVITCGTSHHDEISQNSDSGHQDGMDHCSPFCTCMCCQTSFYVSESAEISTTVSSVMSYYVDEQELNSFEFFEFLIPPKS